MESGQNLFQAFRLTSVKKASSCGNAFQRRWVIKFIPVLWIFDRSVECLGRGECGTGMALDTAGPSFKQLSSQNNVWRGGIRAGVLRMDDRFHIGRERFHVVIGNWLFRIHAFGQRPFHRVFQIGLPTMPGPRPGLGDTTE